MSNAQEISDAYKAGERIAPKARETYELLARYIEQRFQEAQLSGWIFCRGYDSNYLPKMYLARKSKLLIVYDDNHEHPLWGNYTNWKFRAIHDVIAHTDNEMDYEGERIAFKLQYRDFAKWMNEQASGIGYDAGCCALFTEIVGQAAYHRMHGKFPEQKAAMLWKEYRDEISQRDHSTERKQSA